MDNKDRALSIVGSGRNNGKRQENDFYPTPGWCVEELMEREKFNGNIWECACGKGDISDVFKNNGFEVYSTDLIDYGYGDKIQDFLRYDGKKYDNIVTNPPYKYALEFVNQSKKYTNKKIAMFLKTVFLESDGRFDMFQDTEFPLKTMYQFSKRVSLYKDGKKMKNGGMIAYAWYVWDKDYVGKPTIEWIRGQKQQEIEHEFF
tara:strand:- start:52 stop:660 length:609 start_codon:yes stop_codon:yes gene_type:complete